MATDLLVHFWSGANGGGGGGSGSSFDVEDEGSLVVTDPTFINFVGAGVTATLNGAGVDVTIPGGSTGAAFQEVPSGTINGSNVTFTITTAPTTAAGFELFQDGLVLVQGVDYTISGTTITMTVAPNFGQTLYAVYSVVSGVIGVTDVNGVTGSVAVVAGAGINVAVSGQNITISNTGGTTTRTVVGTVGSPTLITAVGGIGFTGAQDFSKHYIAGNGGAVTVTANPQIAAGTVDGQELTLESTDATNTVTLNDGTGLIMNGPWVGGLGSVITYTWNTVSWVEKGRQ